MHPLHTLLAQNLNMSYPKGELRSCPSYINPYQQCHFWQTSLIRSNIVILARKIRHGKDASHKQRCSLIVRQAAVGRRDAHTISAHHMQSALRRLCLELWLISNPDMGAQGLFKIRHASMAKKYSREWGQQADAADTNMSLRSPGRMLCYGDSMSFSGAGWSLAYSLMAASGRCLLYS